MMATTATAPALRPMTLTLPTPMSAPSLTDGGGGSPLQTEWHYNKYYIQIASYNELLQNDVSGEARFLKPLKQDQVIVRFCAKNHLYDMLSPFGSETRVVHVSASKGDKCWLSAPQVLDYLRQGTVLAETKSR